MVYFLSSLLLPCVVVIVTNFWEINISMGDLALMLSKLLVQQKFGPNFVAIPGLIWTQ